MPRKTQPLNDRPKVVIDVETTMLKHGETPKTLFWGAAYQGGYVSFKTTEQLMAWLSKVPPSLLLHHSNFDIIQMLVDGFRDIYIIRSHNNKLIQCSIGQHLTCNTHAVFPTSLAEIFKAFGYQKKSLDDLEARNYDDCVLGLECMERLDAQFMDLIGISPLCRGTIAGTAFAAAEKEAGPMPKNLEHLDAYRGGRVEVFDARETLSKKYDVNSSYPYSFSDFDSDNGQLAYVKVKSSDWHGALFLRNDNERLLFPSGSFESACYLQNYTQYIETVAPGISIEVQETHEIDLSWLRRVRPLIAKLYELKQKSDGGLRYTCKILLNSMYGRIGLRGQSERARLMSYVPDRDGVSAYQLDWDCWLVFDTVYREPRSNFSLAAFITDNARARLFNTIKRVNALYCDTDSVFSVNGQPDKVGTALGEWKYEGTEIFKAENVKDYYWAGNHAVKGGTHNTVWTLKRYAKGEGVMEVDKVQSGEWTKRIKHEDGTTSPIKV